MQNEKKKHKKNDCSSPKNHKMMMTTRAGKFMIHSVLHASLILLTVPFRRKCRKMPLTATVKPRFWTKE